MQLSEMGSCMAKALFCFAAVLGQGLRPGQKIFYKVQAGILHVLGDLRQQVNQILINLQVVGFGGFYQTVDHGTGLRSVDGINDVPVGSANGGKAGWLALSQNYQWEFLHFSGIPSDIFPGSYCTSDHLLSSH